MGAIVGGVIGSVGDAIIFAFVALILFRRLRYYLGKQFANGIVQLRTLFGESVFGEIDLFVMPADTIQDSDISRFAADT